MFEGPYGRKLRLRLQGNKFLVNQIDKLRL